MKIRLVCPAIYFQWVNAFASIINHTKIPVLYTLMNDFGGKCDSCIQIWSIYGKGKCLKEQFMYFSAEQPLDHPNAFVSSVPKWRNPSKIVEKVAYFPELSTQIPIIPSFGLEIKLVTLTLI